jgi:hypothetical protein
MIKAQCVIGIVGVAGVIFVSGCGGGGGGGNGGNGATCTRCVREYTYNDFGQQFTTRNDCASVPAHASTCGSPPPGESCTVHFDIAYNPLGQVISETVDTCQRT